MFTIIKWILIIGIISWGTLLLYPRFVEFVGGVKRDARDAVVSKVVLGVANTLIGKKS